MRNMNALIPEDKDQRILEWMAKKPESETALYDQVFQSADSEIKSRYDSMLSTGINPNGQLSPMVGGGQIAVDKSDRAQIEARNRQEFASYVMRVRLQRGVRNAIQMIKVDPNNPALRSVHKAQRTIDTIRQQSLVIQNTGGPPTVFSFGYDVVTDVSQFRWQRGNTQAGLVHPHFLSSMTGGGGAIQSAFLHLSTSFGQNAPRAFLGVPLAGNSLDLGLAHTLAPSVEAQLRFGSFPPAGDLPHYEVIRATVQLPVF